MEVPDDIGFESSYVTELNIQPYVILIVADFALRAEHPLYTPIHPGEQSCFKVGTLTITGFTSLKWTDAVSPPAIEPDGRKSWNFGNFESDGDNWELEGDWGTITGVGGHLSIKF